MRILNTRKQNKPLQYGVGGTVVVIILGIFVSMPLRNNTITSSSLTAGNPFNSKVADISALRSDVASESGAPGAALSGEMVNNPATSGEAMLSSLFQSGSDNAQPAEDGASSDSAASASGSEAPYGSSGDGGGDSGSGYGSGVSASPGGKLAAVASLSGSNAGSMTAGATHGKFFGSGAQQQEFAPAAAADVKQAMLSGKDKKGVAASGLNSAFTQSKFAAKARDLSDARGGAATAFGGSVKGGALADLKSNADKAAAVSGLELGQAAANLKTSDPSLNKNQVTMPKVSEPVKVPEVNDWKKELIMILAKYAMGMVLGGMGGV